MCMCSYCLTNPQRSPTSGAHRIARVFLFSLVGFTSCSFTSPATAWKRQVIYKLRIPFSCQLPSLLDPGQRHVHLARLVQGLKPEGTGTLQSPLQHGKFHILVRETGI